jgi:hypothetical protein
MHAPALCYAEWKDIVMSFENGPDIDDAAAAHGVLGIEVKNGGTDE